LVELESEAFICGAWKTYDELEDTLSVPELISLVSTLRKMKYEDRKFAAALKGVDLEGDKEDPIAAARRKNSAKKKNVNPDDVIANVPVNKDNGIGYEVI